MKFLIFLVVSSLVVFAQKPSLLLLKTYKDQNITGWVMSEKLDGIRAYWNGEELLTRNGNKIYAPVWFTKDYPLFEIDGELWSKRKDFENISSIVRDKKPSKEWREIKHCIFEAPHAKDNLKERLLKVKTFLDNECTITAYNEGQGKYSGLMGSVTCKLKNNVTFKIGSGFSLYERQNPPSIGSFITFKFKEFTKYGKLRFPVFLRVRDSEK